MIVDANYIACSKGDKWIYDFKLTLSAAQRARYHDITYTNATTFSVSFMIKDANYITLE